MKRIFYSIAMLGALCSPVIAQEVSDNTSGAADSRIEFKTDISDEVAMVPTGIGAEADDLIAAGGLNPPGALSLNDDQLEKIAKLKAEFSDASAAKVAQLRSLSRQQKDLLTQEKTDKSQILDIQNKINSLKNELSNAKLNMKLETISLLTAEQKQKLHHVNLQRQVFGGAHKAMRGRKHMRKHGAPGCPGAPAAPVGAAPADSALPPA